LTKYISTNITAKKGINFVRSVVENSGCLFHKIEQENDLGIDAIIEFVKDEKPVHKSLAIQVKSGNSYYIHQKRECIIPIENHYDYWKNYPLGVCGIVYIPDLNSAFWVNIKSYLVSLPQNKIIRFIANRSNQFDLINFNKLFLPSVLNETPKLLFKEAISFFNSDNYDEFVLGTVVLFRRYINQKLTWNKFLNHIKESSYFDININIIYYLAHIPWHPDIDYGGISIKQNIKNYVKEEFNSFDRPQIIKLLNLIDEENGICRGSIGQSIEAILSTITNINSLLEQIILDKSINLIARHNAAVIYAYYRQNESLELLKKIGLDDSWYIPEIVKYIEEYKNFNPYQ